MIKMHFINDKERETTNPARGLSCNRIVNPMASGLYPDLAEDSAPFKGSWLTANGLLSHGLRSKVQDCLKPGFPALRFVALLKSHRLLTGVCFYFLKKVVA